MAQEHLPLFKEGMRPLQSHKPGIPRRTEAFGSSAPWTRPTPCADVQSANTLANPMPATTSGALPIAPQWIFLMSP